jgi:hypothetical protein
MKEYRNEKGQLHREDGHALEHTNGSKYWYINGLLNREDGPAIEYNNGNKSWFLNDIRYSEEEFHQELIKIKLKRLVEL